MVIPMSPPGHVFAFSLLNRCFPGAKPSGFTMQRQDLDEMLDLATQKAPARAVQVAVATAAFLLVVAAAIKGHERVHYAHWIPNSYSAVELLNSRGRARVVRRMRLKVEPNNRTWRRDQEQ
eukprot:CAMPEP_0181178490 /NCGR_PEP_ID=MMETSP1096-20121128/5751_1 /TAXON_ID=156174 ORGANISM="Chrysochromulina ericina, Strain CCMP281" /NCGR_SAMPLE_ID=MMETSP1096 /ASSEMBLY_ACC=CAM_ASM_000453 /LENGTH=120 /DNA_ID=CAMNT_0023266769 /DNA_START=301 /DNA_END=661 /DNA_ORIENTATION=-